MTHAPRREELLSRYLDDDLPQRERRRLEGLLENDAAARERLDEMRRVVEALDALPREVTPPTLDDAVRRRVAADSVSRRWLDRVQQGVHRLVLNSPLPASFAVVLALAVSFYLLAHGVARRADHETSLVVAPAPGPATPETGDVRDLDGRRFRRLGDRWWQEGVESASGPVLRGEELQAWLALHPEDGPLARLGGEVVVAGEDGTVVLGFGAAAP
ncbi:MAG: hypothetical protein R2991_05690 [Thermoanaerobaculia bacterium]